MFKGKDRPLVGLAVATFGAMAWESAGTAALISSVSGDYQAMSAMHLPVGTLAESRNRAAEDLVQQGCRWLVFLDGDDRLSRRYPRGVKPSGPDIQAPRVQNMRYMGKMYSQPDWLPEGDLQKRNWIVVGAPVRAELFMDAGGFDEWPAYEDWALWLKLTVRHGGTIGRTGAESVYHLDQRSVRRSVHRNALDPQAERLLLEQIRQEYAA